MYQGYVGTPSLSGAVGQASKIRSAYSDVLNRSRLPELPSPWLNPLDEAWQACLTVLRRHDSCRRRSVRPELPGGGRPLALRASEPPDGSLEASLRCVAQPRRASDDVPLQLAFEFEADARQNNLPMTGSSMADPGAQARVGRPADIEPEIVRCHRRRAVPAQPTIKDSPRRLSPGTLWRRATLLLPAGTRIRRFERSEMSCFASIRVRLVSLTPSARPWTRSTTASEPVAGTTPN